MTFRIASRVLLLSDLKLGLSFVQTLEKWGSDDWAYFFFFCSLSTTGASHFSLSTFLLLELDPLTLASWCTDSGEL